VTPSAPSLIRAVVVGVIAGLLSGLFGVGGGIILVPALVLVVGMGVRSASATSLATVLPIAISGLVGYAIAGEVDVGLAAWLALGALAGTFIGTRLLRRLPERILLGSFALLLTVIAIRLLQSQTAAPLPEGSESLLAAEAAGIGLFTGVLSGLFGVGGGFVIVPALVLLLGQAPALAKGTSLLAMLPPALFGTVLNTRRSLVDWRVVMGAGLAGAAFSYLTAGLSVGLDPKEANAWFAALLLAVAFRMAVLAYRHPLHETPVNR
jgi:uncharacterized membrane protein YfcA